MQFFKNMKIRYKLILLMTLVSTLSLLLVGGTFIIWGYASSRQILINTITTQAEMIADNCQASVMFDDSEDAISTLKTLRLEPSIVYAGIYTDSGQNFAYYHRDGEDVANLLFMQENGYRFENGFLSVCKDIVVDEKTIGYVYLRSDLKPLRVLVSRNIAMVVSVLICAVLVAYLLAIKFQHIISGPILKLADIARKVSQNKEYGIRAVKNSDDETGTLIDAFNDMLTEIQRRDLQMTEINQNLEQKVQERTAELTWEIAERKSTEDRLREERNFSQGIIETAQAIILVLDNQGKIVSFNPFMEEKSGYHFEEVKGKNWLDVFLPKSDRSKIGDIFDKLLNGMNTHGIVNSIKTKSGHLIEIEWYNKTLKDDAGNVTGILAIGQDVTERKKYENKLKKAKQEAETADKTKSLFLANMSHEIRTPMNAIIGFSDLLSEEPLNQEQTEFVKLIKSAGRNLLGIINDILDFSKIEAKKLKVERVEFSLEEMLNEMDSIMRPTALKKQLAFEVIQCGKLPKIMQSDPLRIRQCLTNLINNAIKFTEQGHVYVNVSTENRKGKDCVVFDVEDTGIGVSREKIESIFLEFNQADNSTTRKYGGTGLGLAITKRLAELMGGSLNVASEPGKGSTFSLVIPAGVDLESAPQSNKYKFVDSMTQPDTSDQEVKFTGKVLIAEDNPSNQILIKMLVEKTGLEATVVDDGLKVLEAVKQDQFDIIFMDIQMPRMNGHETVRNLRKQNIDIPIVALTANAMKGDDQKCIDAGCNDYLSKPIDRVKLLEILKKHLSCQIPQSS